MTRVGLLFPGSMGAAVGAAAHAEVLWASDGRSEATSRRAASLRDVGSVAALVGASDIVLSICPPAIAEEVAQETFVRVFRHAGNYDARKGRVSTWLLSIARNLAIDVTRMRRLDPVDPELIAAELSLTSQEPGVDERDLQPDEREQLRSAITELPDDQRRALVLAAYMGRTAREISDLDDVPLGTVKTRIRTAMLKLRDELLVGEE